MSRPDLLLKKLELDDNGIYCCSFENTAQAFEISLREKVAAQNYDDYLKRLSRSHSIPVMDREVSLFLKQIPNGGKIIDVGGCWGWHWRTVHEARPDVSIYIVDFVKANLLHAKNILQRNINKNIFLIHGDANDLTFECNTFDGYWSVQTLQHIPDYAKALSEARRVLKGGGQFACTYLNSTGLIRLIYRILGKPYVIDGQMKNGLPLFRASKDKQDTIAGIFKQQPSKRFTEILFQPDLKCSFCGREHSLLGKLDRNLSGSAPALSFFARQCSYHCVK